MECDFKISDLWGRNRCLADEGRLWNWEISGRVGCKIIATVLITQVAMSLWDRGKLMDF